MNPIKILSKTIALTLISVLFSACADDVAYVKPFPEMDIQLGAIKDIYYYNETLILNPDISYGDATIDDADFSYRWSLLKEGGLTLISEEKQLELLLDSIGSLSLYLHVENNNTHAIESQSTTIQVESTSNQGWYVLKETADGNTEVDGYYVSSSLPDYDIITQHLGSPLAGAPRSFGFSPYYKWKASEESTSYSTAASLMAFSAYDGLAYNVNNATVLSTLENMFFLSPGAASTNMMAGLVSSEKVFISREDGAYSMNDNNPAFFPVIEGDYRLDGYFTVGSYGNTLAYDNKNERFVLFASAGYYTSDTLGVFKDQYSDFNNGLEVPVNNMNGQVTFLENTQRGTGYSATTYAYALFQKHDVPDALTLYGLDYDKFVEGYYYYYPTPGDYSVYTMYRAGQWNPITFEKTFPDADYPMLTSADHYTLNKVSNILYFAKGNTIGLYNIDDESYQPTFINTIPGDEEVTFLKYVTCNYQETDIDFIGLVVATYQSTSDTYHIYLYQLDGLTSVTLRSDVKTGTGKVSKILYVSASSYSWSSDLYQYN